MAACVEEVHRVGLLGPGLQWGLRDDLSDMLFSSEPSQSIFQKIQTHEFEERDFILRGM